MTTADNPNLASLPPELLLEVVSYLPISSLIALKLVNKHLLLTTPTPPQNWNEIASDCEKTAAYRALTERKELDGGRRKCVHCGILAPLRRFSGNAPLCHWHQARFMSTSVPSHLESSLKIRLLVLARQLQEPVWVRVARTYCVHEREIVKWHVGKCGCGCNSCGHFPVPCLVRLWNHLDAPQLSELTRDGQNINEEHWVPSRTAWVSRIYARDVLGKAESLVAYRKVVPIIDLQPE